MTKLLSANFLRLWRNKAFWASAVACILLGTGAALGEFQFQVSTGADLSVPEVAQYKALLEGQFFQCASYIGILTAALISLFLGTEYSDGCLRNKVATGCSRTAIYFANLITAFAASLLCLAGHMLSCLAVGVPLLGWFTKSASLIVSAIAGSVFMLAAFCAIFTFLTMNFSRKSTSVVVCLLGVFILLLAAIYLYGRLDAPEHIAGYMISVDGITLSEPELNPSYLAGTEREVFQFLFDLLPTGQSVQYTMLSFTDPLRLMGLAAAVTAVFSAAGAALFQRKDLK